MIFHPFKCVYVQAPKCASTSVMTAFGLDWYHPDAHLLNDITSYNYAHLVPTYFRFSTVRNPFDRLISGWKYCGFTKHRSLLDVLKNLPRPLPVPSDPRDPHTEFGAYHHIVRTQRSRLFSGEKLEVHFLMRYETLQDDFDLVCDLVGKPKCVLPRENNSERRPYQEHFEHEPEALEIASQLLREDLLTFNYQY